jgi:hypothetical protein
MVRIDVEDCTSSYLGFHNSACVVSHDGEYSNTLLISKGACWFFMAMSELDSALEFHTCSRSSTYAQSWVFELTFSLRSSLSHILCWCIGPWNHIRRFRIAELARPLSGSGIANHCLGLCSFLLPFRFSRRVSIPVSRRQGHCKAERAIRQVGQLGKDRIGHIDCKDVGAALLDVKNWLTAVRNLELLTGITLTRTECDVL